jgi:small multidrug resistance pump
VAGVEFLVMAGAIAGGVTGTLMTRASRGFTRYRPALAAIAAYALATVLEAWLLQRIPAGVVYAVWTGTAAAVLVAVDHCVFHLPHRWPQLVGMLITLAGVAVLSTVIA